MSTLSLFEKLDLKDDKTLLIQGVPSSLEKAFAKISYAKNVTPLLKSKKIDFVLIFAVNQNQLGSILKDVFTALHVNSKLWIAYPKLTSKIVSDLNRDNSWQQLSERGYSSIVVEDIDNMWNAIRFKKTDESIPNVPVKLPTPIQEKVEITPAVPEEVSPKNLVVPPEELEKAFKQHVDARNFFSTLSVSNQREYVTWIQTAKREETRLRRLEAAMEKLNAGKRTPNEK